MTSAIEEMKCYLDNKKKQIVEHCGGCTAHEFCSECIMTQNKNKNNLLEYMKEVCVRNRNNAKEYLEKKEYDCSSIRENVCVNNSETINYLLYFIKILGGNDND